MSSSNSSVKSMPDADHLCVIVHGLWGNPGHLETMQKEVREKFGKDIHILVAKRNADSNTYDGIAVGGERVAQEIEDELKTLKKAGQTVSKISIVGYSLGGLFARYCIGLLYSRGIFDTVKPINFTAFASPFLGARAPRQWYTTRLWNRIASNSISESGQQMFLADTFRDTGRPLLAVMADPDSIFMKGLALFKHRSLYANIVNERLVPWHTASISETNPYADLHEIDMNFLPGYGTTLLDPDHPFDFKDDDAFAQIGVRERTRDFMRALPFYAVFTSLVPILGVSFAIYSTLQTMRSTRRIRMHEEGELSSAFDMYRIPVIAHAAIESSAKTAADIVDPPQHLAAASGSDTDSLSSLDDVEAAAATPAGSASSTPLSTPSLETPPSPSMAHKRSPLKRAMSQTSAVAEKLTGQRKGARPLDLTRDELDMVERLNALGFRKYPVWITQHRHSHAAIIVRDRRRGMEEGLVVLRHWLNEEFEL